jgi:hypothetical protein
MLIISIVSNAACERHVKYAGAIYTPKFTTSKTFALPSSATLANNWPSALAETAITGAK